MPVVPQSKVRWASDASLRFDALIFPAAHGFSAIAKFNFVHPTTLPSHLALTSAINGSPLAQAAALASSSFDP